MKLEELINSRILDAEDWGSAIHLVIEKDGKKYDVQIIAVCMENEDEDVGCVCTEQIDYAIMDK